MKTKVLAIFALAAILMACDNNGQNEPQFAPGQKIVVMVGMESPSCSKVPSRKINGTLSIDGIDGFISQGKISQTGIAWNWEPGDKVYMVLQNRTCNRIELTLTDYAKTELGNPLTGQWGKFEGVLPMDFDVDNDIFTIECGPTELTPNQVMIDAQTFASNLIHFKSVEKYHISDLNSFNTEKPIKLIPEWSDITVRINLNFTPSQDEGKSWSKTDAQQFLVKIKALELYGLKEDKSIDEDNKYQTELQYTCQNQLNDLKISDVVLPIFVPQVEFKHGILLKVILESDCYTKSNPSYTLDVPSEVTMKTTSSVSFINTYDPDLYITKIANPSGVIRGIGLFTDFKKDIVVPRGNAKE